MALAQFNMSLFFTIGIRPLLEVLICREVVESIFAIEKRLRKGTQKSLIGDDSEKGLKDGNRFYKSLYIVEVVH